MIAVLSHSYSMARIWLDIDYQALFSDRYSGALKDGRQFRIFTREEDLHTNQRFDEIMVGPPVVLSRSDYAKLFKMEQIARHMLRGQK